MAEIHAGSMYAYSRAIYIYRIQLWSGNVPQIYRPWVCRNGRRAIELSNTFINILSCTSHVIAHGRTAAFIHCIIAGQSAELGDFYTSTAHWVHLVFKP